MKRAIWVALATGTMISGAAAVGVPDAPSASPRALAHFERAAVLQSARESQRAGIEVRYQEERSACGH